MTATGGGGQTSSTTDDDHRVQKQEDNKEAFRIIKEMSDILNTGLDAESLGFCLRLCEEGVNPAGLAHLIKDWRKSKHEQEPGAQGQVSNGNTQ